MIDIIRLCQRYRVPYLESGSPHCGVGWVQLDCPWCQDSDDWHLGFNIDGGYFHCWKCGGHSAVSVVSALLHINDAATVRSIIGRYQRTGTHEASAPIERHTNIDPPAGCGPLSPPHRRYLKRRRYRPGHLSRLWGIRGTRYSVPGWSWRIIIPIRNASHDIVAYQGRAIASSVEPKYRMSRNEDIVDDPHTLLYGIEKVPGDTVLIVEGVTGVWRLGPGAVATFGIDWHTQQANILRKYRRRFIMFDPEKEAQQQATKLANWMSIYPGETELIDGLSSDPGDLTDAAAQSIMADIGITPVPHRSIL